MHTDELFIYNLFEAILKKSSTIDGRYFIAADYGSALNSGNVGKIVTDALSGMTAIDRKYPCALQFPPVEQVSSYKKGISKFRIDMFFLTKDGATGDNTLKSEDVTTRTSRRTVQQDWADMKALAMQFRVMLNKVSRLSTLRSVIHPLNEGSDSYSRISHSGNDKVNGIWLQFYLSLSSVPCDENLTDYPEGEGSIDIPSTDPQEILPH